VILQPQQTLAHSRLVEKIGEGGMGVVWKAEDTKLGRMVAVKVLAPGFAEDRQRLARMTKAAALPVQEALDVARRVAECLGAAHEAGVIHQDLKPGNVIRRARSRAA